MKFHLIFFITDGQRIQKAASLSHKLFLSRIVVGIAIRFFWVKIPNNTSHKLLCIYENEFADFHQGLSSLLTVANLFLPFAWAAKPANPSANGAADNSPQLKLRAIFGRRSATSNLPERPTHGFTVGYFRPPLRGSY